MMIDWDSGRLPVAYLHRGNVRDLDVRQDQGPAVALAHSHLHVSGRPVLVIADRALIGKVTVRG
jgi:hypothetical protein